MSRGQVDRLYGSSAPAERQRAALVDGSIPVAVYGLGKMGLPLAGVYAEVTGDVTGVDIDPAVVGAIETGESHIAGEPGLSELIAEQVRRDRLRATTDGAAAAADARVHVIIVPTLVDDDYEPDLSTIEAVVDDIAVGLAPGDLVIAESTLPPGTCRDVIKPHLAAKSGLEPGEFGVAFCPERTASGTALRDIRGEYPKVVGGVDEESTRAAALVYGELSSNDVHVVSDATTAEAVKVFEGVYRDVNIALANELARITDELGISVREAIATANDLPMCHLHDPGPGVGGHCIPNYPHFLLSQTADPMCLTRTARTINEGMPGFTVSRLVCELASGGVDIEDASVLVCGFTYRPGVAETRAAPALQVVSRLRELGATVYGVDPLVDPEAYGAHALEIDELASRPLDAAVLVTPHEEFERIDWDALEQLVVVDGRDALDLEDSHHRTYTLGGSQNDRPTRLERVTAATDYGLQTRPSRPDGGDVARE
ncbi:nucleotide sugar dehydrogenase [Natrononativus amylolyticus]|uniref:nucleotide sugar dehydrogenase n=1 Tax=Natrononativus amylolyticus TaxID=2963434 RepID=UPI0020CD775D|nr:nucleotide sugar dehydrogenase [Natrononativus amylolyticus]